jgi:hypothetical protein
MTNSQSKFRSGTTALLTLVVFAGIIAGVYLELDHAIQQGNQAHLHQRLILWTVLMSLPGVVTAFLLGFSVRLVTNPKTRWLLPSILVGAGVGITFRAVANKIQPAEQPHPHMPPLTAPKQHSPLAPAPSEPRTPLAPPETAELVEDYPPPPGARLVDAGEYRAQLAPAPAPGRKTPWSIREIFGLPMSKRSYKTTSMNSNDNHREL